MTALTANLKHLYQRRGMWFLYLILLPFLCVGIGSFWQAKFSENVIEIMMTAIPVLGIIMTTLMTDVFNKPVSFCLPGHQAVARNILIFIGIILSVFTACLFITYPAYDAVSSRVMILTGFFTGLLLYWLGVFLALQYPRSSHFIGFWPLIVFWVQEASVLPWVERYCWVLTGLGVISSVAMWVWLGQKDRHRRLCGIPYIGFFDAYNINRTQRIQQQRASRKIVKTQKWETVLEPWILRRISTGGRGINVLIWRAAYILIGPFLMYWKQAVLIWFLLSIWFCYWGFMGFMVSFCIGFGLAMVDLRIYANSVRELDRRQLYVSTLVSGVVLLVFALLIISVLTAITHCIAPWMPTFDLRGEHGPFIALPWAALVFPVLLIPAGLMVQLFFYRSRRLMLPVVMGAAFGLIGAFTAASQIELFKEFGWLYLFAVCLLLWIGFACALRYVCRTFDLIKL